MEADLELFKSSVDRVASVSTDKKDGVKIKLSKDKLDLSVNNTHSGDGNESVSVKFTGLLPDLFEENQGMVATGKYIDGIFYASEILAKHDETYMPSEVIDALKEQGVYQEPD